MLAAGLAYFAFTSLIPVFLLGVIVVGALGGQEVIGRALSVTSAVLGDQVGAAVTTAVFSNEAGTQSVAVALLVMAWSAFRLFGSTDRAFAAIYDEREHRTLLSTVWNSALVFATNLAALALLAVIAVVFVTTAGFLSVVAPLALLVALVAVFTPMFYVFPRAELTLREALPGAIFASGAWAVASVLLGVYAGTVGSPAYGAVGALLLILAWLYVGGLAILLGASLNAVLGGHVEPDSEWVPTAYL
jgi:membrane protein